MDRSICASLSHTHTWYEVGMLKVFEYIAYTEQGENYGTMIIDGVYYAVIHLCRVILSRTVEPSRRQFFPGEYLVISTSTFVSRVSIDDCVSPSMLRF